MTCSQQSYQPTNCQSCLNVLPDINDVDNDDIIDNEEEYDEGESIPIDIGSEHECQLLSLIISVLN